MQKTEAAAFERDRQTPEKCRMVHIFNEGKFEGVYDWSIWLLERCGVKFNMTLQSDKAFGQTVRTGFPNGPSSWEKYTPKFVVTDPQSSPDHTIFHVPESAFDAKETPEEMAKEFEEWKKAKVAELSAKAKADPKKAATQPQPPAPAAPHQATDASPLPRNAQTVADIVHMLSAFDTDGRSPRECQEFLRTLQAGYRRLLGF